MKILMAMAEGFEEIEAITVIDVLRRAGMDIETFSITDRNGVSGAHGVEVKCDRLFREVNFDNAHMIILPGGMPGTTNLNEHAGLREVLINYSAKEKWLAAICAAPTVFGSAGIINGKEVTCYPGCEGGLKNARLSNRNVVVDGRIITSRGPGTAAEFALKIVEILTGESKAQELKAGMLIQ